MLFHTSSVYVYQLYYANGVEFWAVITYNQTVFTLYTGGSPSGKAPVFGTGIRGFESLTPSHIK